MNQQGPINAEEDVRDEQFNKLQMLTDLIRDVNVALHSELEPEEAAQRQMFLEIICF